jgi:WD40 repeat protein
LLSSASRDGTILGWNSVNGRSLFLFNQHTSSVNELVFAPLPPEIDLSNERMVSAGDDGTIRFLLPQNNQLLLTLTDIPLPGGEPSPDSGFLSLAFTSDGFILAGGNRDGKISLWNGFTGEPYRSFNAHPGIAVQDLSFRPGTSFLTSLGEDGILRVWNANPAVDIDQPEVEPLRVVDIFSGSVNDLAASPDGTLLASAHDDGAVRLWDLGTGSLVSVLRAHNGPVNSVSFHPAGELVVSGGNDGSLRIWDITQINGPGDPLARSILGHRNLVLQVAFSPDGLHVISASADGTLRLWEPETGAPLGILRSGQDWITALAYSPDGTLLAVGDERGVLQVWNTLPPGAPVLTDKVNFIHQGPILSLAFSGDSTLLASGGEDAKIILQNPSVPENALELAHHTRRITGVAFSPSGTNAAGVGTDGILSIWNSSKAEIVFSFTEPWPMNTVTYLPSVIQDVELVLTGSLDGTIHLWRITFSK